MRKRILVVDDDVDILVSVVELLEDHGYTTVISAVALEAYKLLRTQHFDAVVLDMMLDQGATGVDVLKGLLRDGKGRPPVICLSALPFDDLTERWHGAVPPYLAKPFESHQLLQLLARVTGTKQ